MRRFASAAVIVGLTLLPAVSSAQSREEQQQRRQQEEAKEAKKKAAKEANAPLARLPGERNVGPCPFVKVLYDAHRYVEFQGGREASAAVGFTGEIQGISADCRYQENDPISVSMDVGFLFGKGPQATGDAKTYTYWVAVTERNKGVLAKEYFTVPARFTAGQDRVLVNERIDGIVIPRAAATTSGSNFEVLVGFEVTPEMAAFNRDGKRFRVNAQPVQAAAANLSAASPPAAPQP